MCVCVWVAINLGELQKVPEHGCTFSYRCLVLIFARDMEEERVVDFLNLRPENVDALRTYLTPEQTRLAQQGSGVDSTFTAEWTKQLENIVMMISSCCYIILFY